MTERAVYAAGDQCLAADDAPALLDGRRERPVAGEVPLLLGVVGFVAGIALVVLADRPVTELFGGDGSPTHGFNVGVAVLAVVAFVVAARATRGRPIAARVLVMLAGLAAASALTVGLATLVPML